MSEARPTSCPGMGSCKKKVDEIDYLAYCSSKDWVWCPLMKEEAKKYMPKVLPCEWKMIKKLEVKKDGEK